MKKLTQTELNPLIEHIVQLFHENGIKSEDLPSAEPEGTEWLRLRNLLAQIIEMKANMETEEKLKSFRK